MAHQQMAAFDGDDDLLEPGRVIKPASDGRANYLLRCPKEIGGVRRHRDSNDDLHLGPNIPFRAATRDLLELVEVRLVSRP